MRTGLVIAACVVAMVLVGGVLNQRTTAAIAEAYVQTAAELHEMCRQKDWQRSMDEVLARRQSWERTEKWLQMLINHEDTDAVMQALGAIRAGIEAEDLASCYAACHQLNEAAEHIYHRDAFTLGNIL